MWTGTVSDVALPTTEPMGLACPNSRSMDKATIRSGPRFSENRTMRVAYIVNALRSDAAATRAVCELLCKRGASVVVLVLSGNCARPSIVIGGRNIELRVHAGPDTDYLDTLRWLEYQISVLHADLVWTACPRTTLLGQIIARRLGRPVVSWQHGHHVSPLCRMLLRLRSNATDLWVADSESAAMFVQDRLGVLRERLLIWPLHMNGGGTSRSKDSRDSASPARLVFNRISSLFQSYRRSISFSSDAAWISVAYGNDLWPPLSRDWP